MFNYIKMNEIHRDHLIPGELYFIECLTQIGNGEIIKNTNTKMMAGFFHHYEVINSYVGPWVSISMSWFPLHIDNILYLICFL
jgi:hypothetical protein